MQRRMFIATVAALVVGTGGCAGTPRRREPEVDRLAVIVKPVTMPADEADMAAWLARIEADTGLALQFGGRMGGGLIRLTVTSTDLSVPKRGHAKTVSQQLDRHPYIEWSEQDRRTRLP